MAGPVGASTEVRLGAVVGIGSVGGGLWNETEMEVGVGIEAAAALSVTVVPPAGASL